MPDMKPCLFFAFVFVLLCPPVPAQTPAFDTVSDFSVEIIVPDDGYVVVDGRTALNEQYTYFVTPAMKVPKPAIDRSNQIAIQKRKSLFFEKKNSSLNSMTSLSPEERYYRFMESSESQTG